MPVGLFTSDGFNSDLTNDLSLAEAALAQLADGSGREALPERPCARCGHEIPWEARSQGCAGDLLFRRLPQTASNEAAIAGGGCRCKALRDVLGPRSSAGAANWTAIEGPVIGGGREHGRRQGLLHAASRP
jgi:hypothetical protein